VRNETFAAGSRGLEELAVLAAIVCAPGGKTVSLLIQLIGKIYVGLAIQEVAQVKAWPLKMYRVDLKVAPIESSVGIVVVDLAFTLRILSALNSQR
jgi:hypothetical protein